MVHANGLRALPWRSQCPTFAYQGRIPGRWIIARGMGNSVLPTSPQYPLKDPLSIKKVRVCPSPGFLYMA